MPPPRRPGPTLDIDRQIRETARAIAAGEASRSPATPAEAPDTPRLPALAEALAPHRAEESTHSSGRRRVVTADGAEYCLEARPGVSPGGLVPRLAVPTTCP
ncbi:MAG: hypothetical protein KDG52_07170 [Rhodocyclaceae bacterium]|nr:hypothetical protein [Rhodocyclaceae bacterium]